MSVGIDESMRQHMTLLDAAGQAVIATDLAGNISHWNDVATRLYGWEAAQVVGRNILDVMPAEVTRDAAAKILQTLSQGEIWSGEFDVQSREGGPLRVAVTDLPIHDSQRRLAGIIGVSALCGQPARVAAAAEKAAAAARALWPGQITADVSRIHPGAHAFASEPHLIQLLSLLLIHHARTLGEGRSAEIVAQNVTRETLDEFGVSRGHGSLIHLTVAIRSGGEVTQATREMLRTARESNFANRLVAMANGRLFIGSSPGRPAVYHLLLPVTLS